MASTGKAAAIPVTSRRQSARLMRLATYASVATAGMLVAVKVAAFAATDSVSILSSLIDSLLDASASLVTLFAVRHALSPPDREHRFGHGKAEPLAALGQAAFIAGSSIFLLIEAGRRLFDPKPVANGDAGIIVMVFAIIATLALTRFQAYVVKRTDSLAIRSDALHYAGDLLANGGVIIALILSTRLGWTIADPLIAIAIAGFIIFSAVQIARGAFDMLMDRELPEADRRRILDIAGTHPEVRAVHDLRTRMSGPSLFIQLHIEMDGSLNLYRAHVIADTVEAELHTAFPGAEVLIHQDPYGVEEQQASGAP